MAVQENDYNFLKLLSEFIDSAIELYPQAAPVTVENFLKYVDGGHYSNAHFYRVVRMDNQEQNNVKIEVIQGGMESVVWTEIEIHPCSQP